MQLFLIIEHIKIMRKRSKEQIQILKELSNAEPNEVGKILKKYFNAKKGNNK